MGHSFGMHHDFDASKGSSNDPRYDSKGNVCTHINGVMDYMSKRTTWTSCSIEGLTAYVAQYPKFCLDVVA